MSTVLFDSRKRVSGNSRECNFILPRGITASSVKLRLFSIFNSFYSVTSRNNEFSIDGNTLTIPPTTYDVATLALQLDSLVKTVHGAYSVGILNSNYLQWSIGTLTSTGSARYLLGFDTTLTGQFVTLPSLTNPELLLLQSSQLIRRSHYEGDFSYSENFLFSFLVEAPALAQNVYRPSYEEWTPILPVENLQQFSFRLTNHNYEPLEGFPSEWLLELEFK